MRSLHSFRQLIGRPLTLSIIILLTLGLSALFIAIKSTQIVQEKFANQSYLAPIQFYSNTLQLQLLQPVDLESLESLLLHQNYRKKSWGSTLQLSDYSLGRGTDCTSLDANSTSCLAFYNHQTKKINLLAMDELQSLRVLVESDPQNNQSQALQNLALFPQLFAQYIGDSPVLQERISLEQVPRQCIDALLSIEDPHFLEHKGISGRGLLRALWANIRSLKTAQGGSTITQQLVKNEVLSPERTLWRKLKELFIAVALEQNFEKDQILESYLNIVYLGQQGNYQVRGYAAASRFYFDRELTQLNLPQCALLAAIVNSPGKFNPFLQKEAALARRKKVLTAMVEHNKILPEEAEVALQTTLPERQTVELKETAPYFIEAAVDELKKKFSTDLTGYKVYTTLRLDAQAFAQKALQKNLRQLESNSNYHQKNRSHGLQGVVLSSDVSNGEVIALVGGRDHRKSPYNRALVSRRQVGSLFKPLVYLTAFLNQKDFSPLTSLANTPFTYKYGKQVWEPKNYDTSYSEKVPAFFALKESLNIPTARLAVQTGLSSIIKTARLLGLSSPLEEVPSLSLGSFEATPIEVLQVYTNLAHFGAQTPLHFVRRVTNIDGLVVYETPPNSPQQLAPPEAFANVISILQEGIRSGTGQGAAARGWHQTSAGKTGTTSQFKDAWFAGFTPQMTTLVWVGYDDGTPVKLSGAGIALPIWVDFMKDFLPSPQLLEFPWPAAPHETIQLSPNELLQNGVPENKAIETTLLYYPLSS